MCFQHEAFQRKENIIDVDQTAVVFYIFIFESIKDVPHFSFIACLNPVPVPPHISPSYCLCPWAIHI